MNSQKETTTLILSRKVGESIDIGAVKLTVVEIRDREAGIQIDGLSAVTLYLRGTVGASISAENVRISIERVSTSIVRICIVAPPSIKITRCEHLAEAVTS